ncbi:R-spondin-2-like [Mobula hypostoma]|uniref:R-spondin-2-like n=1 Tax=Mobula hypostoma TaxID=723540 RepID=UPI002FC3D695
MDLRILTVGIFLLGCWQPAFGEDTGSLQKCKRCRECSMENGCLSCQHRLFLLIQREGIRQRGECVHVCPVGHYSLRGKEVNHCLRCKARNCEMCFSREFCIKCSPDHYLLKGKCYMACPEGSAPQDQPMDCVDGCMLGSWSAWSPCIRNQRTCGYKWGWETRTRQELSASENLSEPCVALKMTRKCRIKNRHCPGGIHSRYKEIQWSQWKPTNKDRQNWTEMFEYKKMHRNRGGRWRNKGLTSGRRSEEGNSSS